MLNYIYYSMVNGVTGEEREKLDNQIEFHSSKIDDVPEELKGIPVPSWYAASGPTKVDQQSGLITAEAFPQSNP